MQVNRSGRVVGSIATIGFCILATLDTMSQRYVEYDQGNPYHAALEAYLVESERAYSKVIPERDFTTAFVVRNESLPETLPTQIGRYKIVYIDKAELLSSTRKLSGSKEIVVAEIRPIKFETDQLVVSVGEYVALSRKSRLILALSGGIRVSFLYSCSERAFIVREKKLFSV